MAKKNRVGRVLIALGALLMILALSLVSYNLYLEYKGEKTVKEIEQKISKQIEQIDTELVDGTTLSAEEELVPLDIDGNLYIGILELPSLNLSLPVTQGWSYDLMTSSVCQYDGNASKRNLVICGHNYDCFFGRLQTMQAGDEIIFTECSGKKYVYTVNNIELINGWDGNSMVLGGSDNWDITLFTCTWAGYQRVTVRAEVAT